jgi:oligoendopeptidase F
MRFEWDDLNRSFNELGGRPVGSAAELERLLLDEAELDSYVYEQRAVRYFNSTRQTDNPEYKKAYEEYTNVLEPKFKLASFGLLKKYTASPFRTQLPAQTYGLEDRRRQNALSIFREANVDLEKDDSALSQEYFRTTGAMTVTYRGQERTLQQMSKFFEEPDRTVREEAWRLSYQRALADRETLDSIYTRMISLRDRITPDSTTTGTTSSSRKTGLTTPPKTARSSTGEWRRRWCP